MRNGGRKRDDENCNNNISIRRELWSLLSGICIAKIYSKGVVNTNKGDVWFRCATKYLKYYPCNIENFMQPPLKGNYRIPQNYEQFQEDFKNMPWDSLYRKYADVSLYKNRIARKIRYFLKLLRKEMHNGTLRC